MRGLFFCFLLTLCSTSAWGADCSLHLPFGEMESDQLLCREGYALGYSYAHKVPAWVAYTITKDSVHGANVKRKNNFKVDKSIPPQYRSSLKDYAKSGYDRGHIGASATVDFSESANSETFYMSNMTPQLPGFNRSMMGYKGVWGYLESKVRYWVKSRGDLYVISGPIVFASPKTIGNGVAVPDFFYKIIIDLQTYDSIAFLTPHVANTRDQAASYISTVDEIESLTGIDFLPQMDDLNESKIESQRAAALW